MSEAAAEPGFARLLSDERLTRRAVGGDERAFAAIFRRYHQSLFRYCLAIVGNPEDAQDALQNTMIKVLRALPGEERKIELKPWLYRIAHNESIDLLRRRRETRQLDVEQIAPGHSLAEDAATRERLRRLMVDLRELPDRQREVLVMRELGGLDFDEIGAALDTSGAVARQTLYEARQSLRQMEEGREMSCDSVTRALSDGDGRVTRRRDVRAHLRACPGCRAFRDEIKARQHDLAALSPLPAVAAAGMLQGLIGGGQGAAVGGGLAATLGGGAAKTIGASAAAKGVATAAVVAAIGVTAADRSGVIHLGLPGEPDSTPARTAPPVPGSDDPRAGAGVGGGHPGGGGEAHGVEEADSHRAGGGHPGEAGTVDGNSGVVPGKAHGHGRHEPKEHGGGHGYGPATDHPSGQGHEKEHPEAAMGGQETAADQKPPREPGGTDAAPAQPVTPTKPEAPAKPAHPSTPAPASPPSEPPAPPEEAPGNPPMAPEPPAPTHPQPKSGTEKAAPSEAQPPVAPQGSPESPGQPERGKAA
ncbi:MAG TPA: sigma-70 family RNA polymerase sigma factor [Solirubrobacterales bacterium]|nr:sigma-70 family RNA polymerase sigma factor [Solirubrobacterales bacterium]